MTVGAHGGVVVLELTQKEHEASFGGDGNVLKADLWCWWSHNLITLLKGHQIVYFEPGGHVKYSESVYITRKLTL